MIIDYENATNKELELKLGFIQLLKNNNLTDVKIDGELLKATISNGEVLELLPERYCSDISATWPLMIEHGISMQQCQTRSNRGMWIASDGLVIPEFSGKDKNPIRAAVICLIKKLEGEK